MTDREYTPTTEEIREYVETGGEPRPWVELDEAEEAREKARGEAFDRWLAAHDAEVLRAAAAELEDSIHHLDPAYQSDLSFINCTRIDAKLLRERADCIAGVPVKQENDND